jgi:hypothetical protein
MAHDARTRGQVNHYSGSDLIGSIDITDTFDSTDTVVDVQQGSVLIANTTAALSILPPQMPAVHFACVKSDQVIDINYTQGSAYSFTGKLWVIWATTAITAITIDTDSGAANVEWILGGT